MIRSKSSIFNYLIIAIIITIITLGIILRLKFYILNKPLWNDEVLYAQSILTRHLFDFFQPLDNNQKAPPLFTTLCYIVTKFFGYSEYSLRFIPFISSAGSLILFHLLLKETSVSNMRIIVGDFLFSFNTILIYYAQEFKPYSTDVFIFLLICLFAVKNDIKSLNARTAVIYGCLSCLAVITSFPSAFAIAAVLIVSLINKNNKNIKNHIIIASITLIGLAINYAIFHNIRVLELYVDYNSWEIGLLHFTINSIKTLITNLYTYIFRINNVAPFFIFSIIGVFLSLFKKEKIGLIMLLTFAIALAASFFKYYPIYERCALYLAPVIIFFLTRPIEITKRANIKSSIYSTIISVLIFYNANINLNMYSYNSEKLSSPTRDLIQEFNTLSRRDENVISTEDFISYNLLYDKMYNTENLPNRNISIYYNTEDMIKKIDEINNKKNIWIYSCDFRPFKKETFSLFVKRKNIKCIKIYDNGFILYYLIKK